MAGDTVYLAGKDVTVCLCDPIRKTVSLCFVFKVNIYILLTYFHLRPLVLV